jgi:alpha-mannosidase
MFGGFKTPEKQRIGKYSGATRDFLAEMAYDEGDRDDYQANFKNKVWLEKQEQEKYKQFYKQFLFTDFKNPEEAAKELASINILITSQSHMDIAWLWRMYQIVNKAKITLGKAVYHAKMLPYFHFIISQPIMIEWFQQTYPTFFEEFKNGVATNKIECQGGMYVEPDGKIPNGESFCRQRLYGQRYYQEQFGKLAEIEWLTDSFGYNNNIPQIIKKSGSNYFYSIKLSGNHLVGSADWPFNHFKWRSPDGSEVICYSGNLSYGGLGRWNRFKDARKLLKEGAMPECNYFTSQEEIDAKKGEIWSEVFITMGEGDGGHGPQSQEIYQAQYFVETGNAKSWISAIDYFHKYDAIEKRLPIWDGAELYYNLHQGTLTTHCLVKRMNRFFEWNLVGLESLFALAAFKFQFDLITEFHETFHQLWKDTLLLQFHDILPGSSCVEVYDDVYDIWMENIEKFHNLEQKIINLLSEPSPENKILGEFLNFTYYNASDFSGKAPISFELPPEFKNKKGSLVIELSDGTSLPAQIYENNGMQEPLLHKKDMLVFITEIFAWSSLCGKITLQSEPIKSEIEIKQSENTLSVKTQHSTIRFDINNGKILDYEEEGRQIMKGNDFCMFDDWSQTEPAWNIGMGYKNLPRDPEDYEFKSLEILENGPVFCLLKREIILKQSEDYIEEHNDWENSYLVQYICIYSELPGIYFDLRINWHHTETFLKQYFHFNTNTPRVIAEAPYSTEIYQADPTKRSKLDRRRFEVASHCWTIFPSDDNSWGVAYINDGKYGLDIENSTLGISIIRGPEYPDPRPETYAQIERQNRDPKTIPTHIDQGESIINYAIIPFNGAWGTSHIPKYSHFFNQRPKVQYGYQKEFNCGISLSAVNLELAMIKLPEDQLIGMGKELIFRIVETGRLSLNGKIQFDPSLRVKKIELVDILERNKDVDRGSFVEIPMEIEKADKIIISCTLHWNPHEIHTFRISK